MSEVKSELVFSIYPDPVWGFTIDGFVIDFLPNGQFSYQYRKVHHHLMSDHEVEFTDGDQEILKLIAEISPKLIESKFKKELKNIAIAVKLKTDENLKKQVKQIIEKRFNRIFQLLKGRKLYFRNKASDHPTHLFFLVDMEPASIVYNFDVSPEGINYVIDIKHHKSIVKLDKDKSSIFCMSPCWIAIENKLYHFNDSTDGQKLKPFFEKPFIQVPAKLAEKYFDSFIVPAFRKFDIIYSGIDVTEEPSQFIPILSIEESIDGFETLQLYFKYDDFKIIPSDLNSRLVKRNVEAGPFSIICYKRKSFDENRVIQILNSLELKLNTQGQSTRFVKDIDAIDQVFEWINANNEELNDQEIIIESNLNDQKYYVGSHYLEIQGRESNDWFDVKAVVEFEGFTIPFYKFKRHILEGKRNYELPNGTVFRIPDAWFSQYDDLMRFSEESGDSFLIDKAQAATWGMLDNIVGEKNFFEEIPNLHIQKDGKYTISENLIAKLRPYQNEGFEWLCEMAAKNMGACLADDMGLGKTLQMIAVIQRHHEMVEKNWIEVEATKTDKRKVKNTVQLGIFNSKEQAILESELVPTLVVVTPSILHNWRLELAKFAPNLKVHEHSGNNRFRFPQDLYGFHIVLTTYGTVRNDEWLQKIHFEYLILDESQLIKNPRSASFQAVRKLKCKHKVAMTGTPLENSLVDLWSQLSFLNPGILGSLRFFTDEFVVPIEKEGSEAKMQKVKKLAGRLILRRTKEEVAKDLPALTEQIHYCEMSTQQAELYEEQKSAYRNMIIENIDKVGRQRSNILILKGLMQLRLMANHPAISMGDLNIRSGKFDEVMRRLETLKNENRKVLVFSQFVKHLKIYEAEMLKRGWDYSMLIGSTTNRQSVVEEFEQHPGFRVFLISLKAGGIGLNLVSSDMVFLLDPWWNPAVESQAISRAHRIGQQKPVHVYRFITRETIEEKIVNLQDKKRNLAKNVIVDTSFLSSLSDLELRELVD